MNKLQLVHKNRKNMSKKTSFRSAVTGKYVKESYAKAHPKTTVKETDKVKQKPKNK